MITFEHHRLRPLNTPAKNSFSEYERAIEQIQRRNIAFHYYPLYQEQEGEPVFHAPLLLKDLKKLEDNEHKPANLKEKEEPNLHEFKALDPRKPQILGRDRVRAFNGVHLVFDRPSPFFKTKFL